MLSHFSRVWLFVTLWTEACQAPLSRDPPGKNTGVGCCAVLQGIFPTQGLNPCLLWLLHCGQIGEATLYSSSLSISAQQIMANWLKTMPTHHVVVSMGQESRHCFSGSPAQGLSQVAIREVARAGVSSEAQMEKDPLSSSRDGWQDSVPWELLVWEPRLRLLVRDPVLFLAT